MFTSKFFLKKKYLQCYISLEFNKQASNVTIFEGFYKYFSGSITVVMMYQIDGFWGPFWLYRFEAWDIIQNASDGLGRYTKKPINKKNVIFNERR